MTTLGVFRDDFYNATAVLPQSAYTATTAALTVLPASLMVKATENYIAFSGQTAAQAVATDSAANIIAQLQTCLAAAAAANGGTGAPAGVPNLNSVGFFLQLINNNTSSGAITLSAGTGVTLVAGAAIAITTNVQFLVTVTGPNSVSMQRIGSGTP